MNYIEAEKTKNNQYKTDKERENARHAMAAHKQSHVKVQGESAKLQKELDQLVKKYKPGCLEPLFPTKGKSISTL